MRGVLIAVLLAGCGDHEVRLDGPHHQYVMSELRIPSTNTGARADGLDLDGDRAVDNQLGMVFGALKSLGLGVDVTAQEAVLRGGLILLADLQTVDFATTELSGLTTYLGRDPMPAPCLDPTRLETCGQHVLGGGRFSIEPGSESDHGTAPIEEGVFVVDMGLLPLEIALDVDAPLRLDLQAARIRFTSIAQDGFTGVIGGLITQDDVDRVVVPQAAREIARIVGAECAQPTGSPPCGCIDGTRADLLQEYFDDNNSCEVTLAEVATSGVVESLLQPDVRTKGIQGLSFGVGVTFRSATFE